MKYSILQITPSYKPAYIYGGPTISVGNLCEQMVKKGLPVTVLTTTANGNEDFNYKNNEVVNISDVSVRYFKRITKDHSHFSPALLRHLWKNSSKYDVIHIHAWWNLVSVGAALVCVLKNKKFILSPRGTLSNYSFNNRTSRIKKTVHYLLGKQLLRKAVFLVSSAKEREDIFNLGLNKGNKVFIVPNIIELPDDLPLKRSFSSDKLRLIFFSRIEEKKGLEFLIDALNYIDFPVQLDIYGTGNPEYVDKIKEKALANKNADSICFHGAVYGAEKFNILADHDILVLPSYDENFANVVIESLSVGTLVVVTKEVGLADVVVANNMGWFIERDAKNIASILKGIYMNFNSRRKMSEVAPLIIKKMFDLDKIAAHHISLYTNMQNFIVNKTCDFYIKFIL